MYLGDFVELTIIYHVKSLTFIHWPNRGVNCTSWPSPWPGWLIYWMHEVRRRGIRRVHSFIWIHSDYLSIDNNSVEIFAIFCGEDGPRRFCFKLSKIVHFCELNLGEFYSLLSIIHFSVENYYPRFLFILINYSEVTTSVTVTVYLIFIPL